MTLEQLTDVFDSSTKLYITTNKNGKLKFLYTGQLYKFTLVLHEENLSREVVSCRVNEDGALCIVLE